MARSITKSQNEMSFAKYFNVEGSENYQLSIPIFQRKYSWDKRNFRPWFADIRYYTDQQLTGELDESHFCGTVITKLHDDDTQHIDQMRLIDGQQRFVTTYLILLAIVRKLALNTVEKEETEIKNKEFRTDYTREWLKNQTEERLRKIVRAYIEAGHSVELILPDQSNSDELIRVILSSQVAYINKGKKTSNSPKIWLDLLVKNLMFDHSKEYNRHYEGCSNLRLSVSKDDRASLNEVFQEVLDLPEVSKYSSEIPLFIEFEGKPSDSLIMNGWTQIKKFIDEEWESETDGGVARLLAVKDVLLNRFKLIEIKLENELQVTKIFDRLNATGKDLSIGQLVKNDVFGRAGGRIETMEELERTKWKVFAEGFQFKEKKGETDKAVTKRKLERQSKYRNSDLTFEEYLFPYGLITLGPKIQKTQIYNELSTSWTRTAVQNNISPNDAPRQIIKELTEYQDDYMDVAFGTNRRKFGVFAAQIEKLIRLDYPTTMYPFTMRLSNAVKNKEISEDDAVKSLKIIESFLVRRGICQIGTGGLHQLFKTMWDDQKERAGANPAETFSTRIFELLKKQIGTHPWPDDDRFRANLETGDSYKQTKTCRYILEEWEGKFRKNKNNALTVKYEIEHIFPQGYSEVDEWKRIFNTEAKQKRLHRLGNLILLSPDENKDAKNYKFSKKIKTYDKETDFKSAQTLSEWLQKEAGKENKGIQWENADDLDRIWDADRIDERTKLMTEWALEKWKISPDFKYQDD